ncbi:MAG: hypothetical protein AAGA29_10095 [Planctomycetota bacterium]
MRHPLPSLLAFALICPLLTGCYAAAGFGTAPWKKNPPAPMNNLDPVIAGDWSQPVNGVRMAVRQIVGDGPHDEVLLLLLIENTTDEAVHWPGIQPEVDVRRTDQSDNLYEGFYSANLRIIAEPLDDQEPSAAHQYLLDEQLAQLHEPLAPHEIALHAIRLHGIGQMQSLRLQDPNHIFADAMIWCDLDEHEAAGRWRLHLTYRPTGFPLPEGEEALLIERDDEVNAGWEDQQIDLPPIVINLDEWD